MIQQRALRGVRWTPRGALSYTPHCFLKLGLLYVGENFFEGLAQGEEQGGSQSITQAGLKLPM